MFATLGFGIGCSVGSVACSRYNQKVLVVLVSTVYAEIKYTQYIEESVYHTGCGYLSNNLHKLCIHHAS